MKAFTSFSSKPFVHKLGSFSPSKDFHVSDKPFSCFILPFRNEQKVSIFCLLKLVQNKGIYPFHAVSPEHQEVELETVESQDQQSENESKFVRVEFQLQKDCDFGEQFFIVGNDPKLGSWNPLDALPMTWSDGHIWTLELDIPAGKSIQYKFILKGKLGDIIWQPGPDRIIQTWETISRIIVSEDWENAELQKIIEEDSFSQQNEESQVLSEVSTSAEISDSSRDKVEFNVSNISDIEDTQLYADEKQIAEPVLQQITDDHDSISSSVEKPMAIIAENIGPSEDLMESTSHKNNDIIHNLGYNGNAAALKNQEGKIVEGSLIDFEGGPVLVPGLIPETEEEPGQGEVVEEEKTAIEPSIELFETQDQNIPELSKDQESDDETPQETSSTINDELNFTENAQLSKDQESDDETPQETSSTTNDELNLLEEQFHLAPTMEEGSNSQLIDGNALRNDIQWGRETVKKFLTKFGLL